MEEKSIKVEKSWPEPKLVRNIQIFLGFANFYRTFIRNISRIAISLILMFQKIDKLTGNKNQSIQDKKQGALGYAGDTDGIDKAGKGNKNLLNIGKLKN